MNKATVFHGGAVLGFSGLADLGKARRTDLWLVEAIAKSRSIVEVHDRIEAAASAELRRLTGAVPDSLRRQAFVIAGWSQTSEDAPMTPYCSVIHNALDKNGLWLPVPEPMFQQVHFDLGRRSVAVFPIGATLRPAEYWPLFRQLRQAVARDVGPEAMVRLLVNTVRQVANRKAAVGRSVLAVVIPKIRGDSVGLRMRLDRTFDRECVSSVYYPEDARSPRIYEPHWVDARGIVAIDMESWVGPGIPPWARGLKLE